MAITSHKQLIVWQKSMDLVVKVYDLVKKLPKEETYALSDQMRRAAVSIPSNIAEGFFRNSSRQYIQFLSVSRGSAAELETQILIGIRLKYFNELQIENTLNLCNEVLKMLSTMIIKMESKGLGIRN